MSNISFGSHGSNEVVAKVSSWVRTRGLATVVELCVNFAFPYLIYAWAEQPLGQVSALVAASAPPILWSIIEFSRRRRIDALSVLALTGIALSLLAYFGGGGVRFLQLRERLVTAMIGLVFLASGAIGRPLIYQLARARVRARSSSEANTFDALGDSPVFRDAMMVMTLVWGAVLVAEAAVAAALVFILSIRLYLIVSAVFGYGTLGVTTAWTYWYAHRRLRPLAAAQVRSAPTMPAEGD